MAKFEKQLFNQKNLFGMILLHVHAQYIYIVNAKYQKSSVKALVQVDFPAYAQAKSLFKSKQEKNGLFQKAVPLQSLYWATRYNTDLVITWHGLGPQMVIFL